MSLHTPDSPESAEKLPDLVAAVIVKKDPDAWRALMVHNIKDGLRIEPTGGKLNEGESEESGTIREAEEEIGVKISFEEKLGTFETVTPKGHTLMVHTFLCRIIEGVPQIQSAEKHKLGDCRWYTLDELEALPELVPNMRKALPVLRERLAEQETSN